MTKRGWPWLQAANYGLGTLRISWNGNRFTGEVDIGLVNSDGRLGITNGVSTTDDGAVRRPRGVVGVGVAGPNRSLSGDDTRIGGTIPGMTEVTAHGGKTGVIVGVTEASSRRWRCSGDRLRRLVSAGRVGMTIGVSTTDEEAACGRGEGVMCSIARDCP